MATIKLENYNDDSDYFLFPYNPTSVEIPLTKFVDQKNMPYYFTILGFSSPIKSTQNITLNGHFDGDTKNSDYRSLVKFINRPILIKLYFQDDRDKFYLCTGASIQKVPTGNRPLHIDYVGSFFSPFGILYDDNQQDGGSSSSDSNDGDMVTPIEKITGSVSNGDTVKIEDKNGNGFSFTASRSGTFTYYIIKIISEDNIIYLSQYFYAEIDGEEQSLSNATDYGDIMLRLEVDESLDDIFTGGDIDNITPTFYFRNGWASD